MKIILLEKIDNLGNLGDEIFVKPGFARNFLFPKYKAVLASKKNRSFFQAKIKEIEKKNHLDVQKLKDKENAINALELKIFVKTSEKGKLFGSITSKNIAQLFQKHNISIEKNDIKMTEVINQTGNYNIIIDLKNNLKIDKILSVMKEK